MPRGVYPRKKRYAASAGRKRRLRVRIPPAEEKTDLVTTLNQTINQLIKLRDIINGKA